MQLPRYKKKNRVKLKICQESGCGKEFLGHPIAKYCDLHRNIKKRKHKIKILENPNIKNQIFQNNYYYPTDVEFLCALQGCKNRFKIKAYSKQEVYPKYCEEHRSEFKREQFSRTHIF